MSRILWNKKKYKIRKTSLKKNLKKDEKYSIIKIDDLYNTDIIIQAQFSNCNDFHRYIIIKAKPLLKNVMAYITPTRSKAVNEIE